MATASATFEGQTFQAHIPDPSEESLLQMGQSALTREQLLQRIDQLEISADAKLLLSRVSTVVIQVGEVIISVGRRILEIALFIAREFPMAGIGMVLGILIGALVGAIPLLGVVLGPLITPLAAAFGLLRGAFEDFKNKSLQHRIEEAVSQYAPLKGEVHVA